MSPGSRIPLAQRCPQIQKLDARIPLKVHNFHINKASIQMDNLTYLLGTIQVYPGKNPTCVRLKNNAGGSDTDQDCYGESESANESIKRRRLEVLNDQLDNHIRFHEADCNKANDNDKTRKLYVERYEQKMKKLQAEIEEVEKNGYIPPYTWYLQLISINKQGRKVERLMYNRKLSVAFPYLLRKTILRRKLFVINLHQEKFFDIRGSNFLNNWTQPNGALHFDQKPCKWFGIYRTFVRQCLSTKFTKEKDISIKVAYSQEARSLLDKLSAHRGARMSADQKSVTIPRDGDFQINFYWGEIVEHEYGILHAAVERK